MYENDVYVFGINHHVAPVDLREKAACDPAVIPAILNDLTAHDDILEACVLSTCNRSEYYVCVRPETEVRPLLEDTFRRFNPELTAADFKLFYCHQGRAAVRHLFAVGAGLDSMIIGEPQILGQVKNAFHIAHEAQSTGICLNRLFEMSFQVAKQIRSETAISEGAVSVAYAAVELAQKFFKDLSDQKVLVIGSGETGQLIARHLVKKEVHHLYFANRTYDRARQLADEMGGKALPFPLMKELLPEVDLVIGATNAREYILGKADVCGVMRFRKPRPLIFIDIAVPRDFDPGIDAFDNVFLNDLDSLQRIVEQNLARRRDAVDAANRLVEAEVKAFYQWKKSLQLTPTIVSLRNKLEDIREVELQKYQHRTTPQEREMIERATRGMLNKILHLPLSQLKRYSNGNADSATRIDVVREIFDLENRHDVRD